MQQAAENPKGYVLLNLGCGNKILPKPWINVDQAPRHGKAPDFEADIRDLSMLDNDYADVVMAIHVIEHFYRWEIPAILKEWQRVLRPGGLIILECPDLMKAAKHFINGKPDQLTMWPFYGDPKHKDPAMCHRWGYTPQTLTQVLLEAGFVNIEEKPAEYHLGPVRDMRLVGEKRGD